MTFNTITDRRNAFSELIGRPMGMPAFCLPAGLVAMMPPQMRAEHEARARISFEQMQAAERAANGEAVRPQSHRSNLLPFRLSGFCATYGKVIRDSCSREPHRLQPGALSQSLYAVDLLDGHRGDALAANLKFTETATGLWFHAQLNNTPKAREIVARAQATPGSTFPVSIFAKPSPGGSRPMRDGRGEWFNDIQHADLAHVAIVERAADPGAVAFLSEVPK